jgi:hypothetical protein
MAFMFLYLQSHTTQMLKTKMCTVYVVHKVLTKRHHSRMLRYKRNETRTQAKSNTMQCTTKFKLIARAQKCKRYDALPDLASLSYQQLSKGNAGYLHSSQPWKTSQDGKRKMVRLKHSGEHMRLYSSVSQNPISEESRMDSSFTLTAPHSAPSHSAHSPSSTSSTPSPPPHRLPQIFSSQPPLSGLSSTP